MSDFLNRMKSAAKADLKTIVLPEGEDPRTIVAATKIIEEGLAKIVILGNPDEINVPGATVIDPRNAEKHEEYAQKFAELRAKKGVTIEQARAQVMDATYFGTMMVKMGDADGLVSGACHSTADTLRPALQILKTAPGTKLVSAFFVMCTDTPQFGTDGFGTRFAAQCGGKLEPLYPCLTALQTAKPNRSLAGIRAKAAATLLDLDRHCTVAVENGEVQFTDYGLSGICIMQLSGHLAPGRGPKRPAVELDLFPTLDETALTALFAARVPLLPGKAPADFWTGLLNPKLGRALWAAAKLPEKPVDTLPDAAWQVLANAAKHWLFEGLTPCGWKQAQTTGGGLSLTEVTPSFQFKGCPGLYFVGETLDCAGSCGGFNLHWAFGSGIAAGRDAVRSLKRPAPKPNKKKR